MEESCVTVVQSDTRDEPTYSAIWIDVLLYNSADIISAVIEFPVLLVQVKDKIFIEYPERIDYYTNRVYL